jgi:hypothetical protein
MEKKRSRRKCQQDQRRKQTKMKKIWRTKENKAKVKNNNKIKGQS